MLRLSDVLIELGFSSSRKEFKRQLNEGSVRYKNMVVEDDMVFLPTGSLTLALPLGNDLFAIPPVCHSSVDKGWMIVHYAQ